MRLLGNISWPQPQPRLLWPLVPLLQIPNTKPNQVLVLFQQLFLVQKLMNPNPKPTLKPKIKQLGKGIVLKEIKKQKTGTAKES
jgi:hypothetical protein